MILIKKFAIEAARGLGYAFGYYYMKHLVIKANDPAHKAEWKRSIGRIKGKFRIRNVKSA